MERQEIFEIVKELIVKEMAIDEEKITIDAEFESDLGADSLDAIELIMALEERFNIEISEEAGLELKSISDIVDYIEKNI